MRELEYPFDSKYLIKKKRHLKKQLLASGKDFISKKIAILGGSTTDEIKDQLELFLLNYGIQPLFYQSEYNQYYQEAMFENPALEAFAPDIILIHTSIRNIKHFPSLSESKEEIDASLKSEMDTYSSMWDRLSSVYHCPVIQNNFEYPYYRLLGNKDASDFHGKVNYVTRLNLAFDEYASSHQDFYINDINYVSASYGLEKWSDPKYWHMYKYCCALEAIPDLAFNIAKIIKSIFGKNKKGYVLDLDNTLWGGVIGDDGVDNIAIGPETSMGQVYSEFQNYLKEQKQLGVLLNIDSKNDRENAIAGLHHPDEILKEDDFIEIKANWEPKDQNFLKIASDLNLLPESLVFVDDNPAERHIVREQIKGAEAPEIGSVENYVHVLDKSGFFEATNLSKDDARRNEMYRENAKRRELESQFRDYHEYLLSLQMKAVIRPFEPVYMARIAQLTNKSNQFNLTTRRCTQSEIEEIAGNPDYVTLYGKLEDRFGDNGVVSVVYGHQSETRFDIDLWLMSCRVLKRNMEYAMMDTLVKTVQKRGVKEIHGFYYATAKNKMVKDFYGLMGFEKVSEDDEGSSEWILKTDHYRNQQDVIKVEE